MQVVPANHPKWFLLVKYKRDTCLEIIFLVIGCIFSRVLERIGFVNARVSLCFSL